MQNNQNNVEKHKVIKLSCGDIVIGIVSSDLSGTKRIMKKPWEYTKVPGGYTVVPFQGLLYGQNLEVQNLEIKPDHVVYEFELDRVPDLKKAYFERSMSESGIVI